MTALIFSSYNNVISAFRVFVHVCIVVYSINLLVLFDCVSQSFNEMHLTSLLTLTPPRVNTLSRSIRIITFQVTVYSVLGTLNMEFQYRCIRNTSQNIQKQIPLSLPRLNSPTADRAWSTMTDASVRSISTRVLRTP